MYCSSCGVAVAQGLSFCNYCGAKIVSPNQEISLPEVRPQLIISAMAGVFVLSLPGIAFLIFMLNAALHLDAGQVMAFAWTVLLLLVALEGIFTLLLFRRKPRTDESRTGNQLKGTQTKELEAGRAPGLPEPVPSVTEHTTRAFDRISNERT